MADNPILKALPPETDYLTYLTIVEYNLTKERLPSLHSVLQDTDLTVNIGWDLVHILLPLLPESEPCLDAVARLGNPREVILKVTELLENLGRDAIEGGSDSGEDQPDVTAAENGQEVDFSRPEPDRPLQDHSSPDSSPVEALKFQQLVTMLSILHPRIKTKFPSRFLATSLQAILPAYIKVRQVAASTSTLLNHVRAIATSTRPRLPPRAGSTARMEPEPAPDPEASAEPSGSEEAALQLRLLQSFLTHVLEAWVEGLESIYDENGLGWSVRFWERSRADRVLKGRESFGKRFERDERLMARDATMKKILAVSRELKISSRELLTIVTRPEVVPKGDPDDLPSSPSEISLSHTGSLYLLTAVLSQDKTYHGALSLPSYWKILDQYKPSLGLLDNPTPGILPTVDAILFLGLFVFHTLPPTPPNPSAADSTADYDEQADNYGASSQVAQALSEICTTNPSQTLRSQAHNIISQLLAKQHPARALTTFRNTFLLRILRTSPYTSLRASAVTWLKEGLLLTAAAAATSDEEISHQALLEGVRALLAEAFPFLYPEPRQFYDDGGGEPEAILRDVPFLLTSFNLYYLLYSNTGLREMFRLQALNEEWRFVDLRLGPWETTLKNARESIEGGRAEDGEEATTGGWESTQLVLLEEVIGRLVAVLSYGGQGVKGKG